MNIEIIPRKDGFTVVRLSGRLDAHGANELEDQMGPLLSNPEGSVVLDMADVSYLSSAGLRVFVKAWRAVQADGGELVLVAMQQYCRDVLEMVGFERAFRLFETMEEAELALGKSDSSGASGGEKVLSEKEVRKGTFGEMAIYAGEEGTGAVEIVGDIVNVLSAAITPAHVCSKRFSQKEYSIGLGSLGSRVEEYLPLMGEMITIGGTMVWLPCDGNDTPDFIIPQKDTGKVVLRTGFNASLAGPFHEYVEYRSHKKEGASMNEIYRDLFEQAKVRRPDFKGALGIAMRAQMPAVYGSGVLKAPIKEFAPENGKWITDPSNFDTWFEADQTPRHQNVTGLIAGVGVDLSMDISVFDEKHFNATFYVNPANTGSSNELLHNHAVLFEPVEMPKPPISLEAEIKLIVENGEFVDMRHLLDRSTISHAIIGLVYVEDFRADPTWSMEEDAAH